MNGLGEFFFEIRADAESGVIDMLAGPDEDALICFPTRVVATPAGGSAYTFTMFQAPGQPASSSKTSTPPSSANSRTSNGASASCQPREHRGIVDHRQARAHVAGEVERRDGGTEREGREGVP